MKFSNNRTTKLLLAGFFALLINSSYLAGNANPTVFYFANVVLHMVLGVGLAIVVVARRDARTFLATMFLAREAGRPDRDAPTGPMSRARLFPGTLLSASAVLGVAAVLGVFLMIFGATRPYRWALYSHIGFAAAGSALMLAYLFSAARAFVESRRKLFAYLAIACLVFLFPVAST